jgi:hypothetical protein
MNKVILVFFLMLVILSECKPQNVSVISQIMALDSITTRLDTVTSYREYRIIGSTGNDSICSIPGYRGIVFYNYNLREINKIRLQTALLDHLSVLYFVHDSMVKVSVESQVYYRLGKFYYNRQGEEISTPSMNVEFARYLEMFKMAKVVCSD